MSLEYEDPEELALRLRESELVDPEHVVLAEDELPLDASPADVLEQRQEVAGDDVSDEDVRD
jgi:hypothetical protein